MRVSIPMKCGCVINDYELTFIRTCENHTPNENLLYWRKRCIENSAEVCKLQDILNEINKLTKF